MNCCYGIFMMPLGGGNPSAGEERPENKPIPARLEKQTGTEPFLHTAQETNGNGESSPHR